LEEGVLEEAELEEVALEAAVSAAETLSAASQPPTVNPANMLNVTAAEVAMEVATDEAKTWRKRTVHNRPRSAMEFPLARKMKTTPKRIPGRPPFGVNSPQLVDAGSLALRRAAVH
jgi:hypothetical protein